MSEGSSLGLYILVGAIIFGIFVLIVAMFGDSIRTFITSTFTDSSTAVDAQLTSALSTIQP